MYSKIRHMPRWRLPFTRELFPRIIHGDSDGQHFRVSVDYYRHYATRLATFNWKRIKKWTRRISRKNFCILKAFLPFFQPPPPPKTTLLIIHPSVQLWSLFSGFWTDGITLRDSLSEPAWNNYQKAKLYLQNYNIHIYESLRVRICICMLIGGAA